MPHALTICADATPRMGTGHIMRCLALAQAAQRAGMPVRMMGRVHVPWVRARLQAEGVPFVDVQGAVPEKELPAAVLRRLEDGPRPQWVVFDGYHFGPDCQQAVQEAGYRLLVIDDYAHLPEYHCDILLNQNLGAEKLTYAGRVGRFLLGPSYALLRAEFMAARERIAAKTPRGAVRNLLLSLGGGDFSEYLEKVAACLQLPELAGCTLRVLAGAMPAEHIHEHLKACKARVEIVPRVDDMPSLLLDTDLCITAGGSTCWELCCLGVPFLVLEVAENQHLVIEGLLEQHMSMLFSEQTLHAMLCDAHLNHDLRRKQLSMVDGQGAQRVSYSLNQ